MSRTRVLVPVLGFLAAIACADHEVPVAEPGRTALRLFDLARIEEPTETDLALFSVGPGPEARVALFDALAVVARASPVELSAVQPVGRDAYADIVAEMEGGREARFNVRLSPVDPETWQVVWFQGPGVGMAPVGSARRGKPQQLDALTGIARFAARIGETMAHIEQRKDESPKRRTARRVLEIEAFAITGLIDRLDETFDRAVETLVSCTGRVVVTGMGKSGIICQKLAATFSSTGTPAFFMHPAEALHGDLGMIVAGDVLLAISHSGETQEVVRLLELVRRLGASIVTLTGNPQSTLARHADVHLDVGVGQEACTLDLVPTASTCASLAMGDALAVACLETRGFTSDDFARFHPGGHLGRKLLLVSSVMHEGQDVPQVLEGTALKDAVEEMSRKQIGMTCVVDDVGRLTGILTDGDLRRRLVANPAPLEGTARDAMTTSPVTIAPQALATAALELMEKKKITSLPVIEETRRLVGVVQIHDLWRTELF